MELVQMPEGYWQIKNMPTSEELESYYREKYYQEAKGNYEKTYSEAELKWKRTQEDIYTKSLLVEKKAEKCLDIGCGEGFLMDAFHRQGCKVQGVDYSSYGITKENPHLIENFIQCDIVEFIQEHDISSYDCISLMGVIEHILDPIDTLETIHSKMKDDAYFMIRFPNDFSKLQNLLKSEGKISRDFWIAFPDHLSYFNNENMIKVLKNVGFEIKAATSNFPIDFALFNDDSNYVEDLSKGKNVHKSRIMMHNFLYETDAERYQSILKLLAEMGIARELTFICKKA